MLDIFGRIKNVNADNGALGGSKDIGEAEPALVTVPRTDAWRRKVAEAGPFEEPDHEGDVEQADEGSDSQDSGLFAGTGVREAEELLGFAEEEAYDIHGCIGTEEDAER